MQSSNHSIQKYQQMGLKSGSMILSQRFGIDRVKADQDNAYCMEISRKFH